MWAAFSARGLSRLILAGGLYVVVAIAGPVYASIIQRFVVAPNEQVRETPFMEYNIAATRQGCRRQRAKMKLRTLR